jgi:hypothetical protein
MNFTNISFFIEFFSECTSFFKHIDSLLFSSFTLGFSKSADCLGQQQLIYTTTKQTIFFYNPGGVNNPAVANCSSLLGYNVNGSVGLSVRIFLSF